MKNVWKPREESKWFCLFLLVIRFLSGKRFCQYNLSHFFIFICETGGGKKNVFVFHTHFRRKGRKGKWFFHCQIFSALLFPRRKTKKKLLSKKWSWKKGLFSTCFFSLASQGVWKNVNTNKWLNHIQDFRFNTGLLLWNVRPCSSFNALRVIWRVKRLWFEVRHSYECTCNKSKRSYLIKQCTFLTLRHKRNRQHEHGPDGSDSVSSEKLQHVHLAILQSKYEYLEHIENKYNQQRSRLYCRFAWKSVHICLCSVYRVSLLITQSS